MTLARIKGQAPIIITVIGGLASVFAAFLTSSATANSEIASLETKVAVVKTTEELHYLEVQKQLNTIDNKLDGILDSLRENPNY